MQEMSEMMKDELGNEIEVPGNDSNSKTEDPKKTAYHEAGHAIIHELFGWEYIDIRIKDNNEIRGEVNSKYGEEITSNSSLTDKLIFGCICLSGYIAANEYGRNSDSFYLDDIIYLCGDKSGESDWDKYQSLSLSDGNYYVRLQEFTKELIIENWLYIEKIACVLFNKKELTFEEVGKIIDRDKLKEKRQFYMQKLQDISEEVEFKRVEEEKKKAEEEKKKAAEQEEDFELKKQTKHLGDFV